MKLSLTKNLLIAGSMITAVTSINAMEEFENNEFEKQLASNQQAILEDAKTNSAAAAKAEENTNVNDLNFSRKLKDLVDEKICHIKYFTENEVVDSIFFTNIKDQPISKLFRNLPDSLDMMAPEKSLCGVLGLKIYKDLTIKDLVSLTMTSKELRNGILEGFKSKPVISALKIHNAYIVRFHKYETNSDKAQQAAVNSFFFGKAFQIKDDTVVKERLLTDIFNTGYLQVQEAASIPGPQLMRRREFVGRERQSDIDNGLKIRETGQLRRDYIDYQKNILNERKLARENALKSPKKSLEYYNSSDLEKNEAALDLLASYGNPSDSEKRENKTRIRAATYYK